MVWVTVIHAIVFLAFWLTNLSFRQDVNVFLADTTGLKLDFLLVFILFSLLVGLWGAIRLILYAKAGKAGPSWLFNAVGIYYLLFFYGSFIILFVKNPVQIARLGQLVQYFRIFFDTAILLLAAWYVRRSFWATGKRWKRAFFVGGLALLWTVPVFWHPGNVYSGAIPPKPLLVAHRGASMLAPENTLSAMQRAANLGVYGLETDIVINRDGTLFLMHDPTLARTTDIAQVFPSRANDPADSFTWGELAQLSAGQWFVNQDPFGTIASVQVTPSEAASYRTEPIPTLAEMLQVVHNHDLAFIYDLRIPTVEHPYASQTLDMCLAEIEAAGVAPRTWVLAEPDEISVVRLALPDAILANGLDYNHAVEPRELVSAGYQLVNSEYGLSEAMIHAYQQVGLWVNLWTVDEPWQYSRLWLAGADSVTSNNVQTPIAMTGPVMAMPMPLYFPIWGLVGVLAAGVCFWKGKSGS